MVFRFFRCLSHVVPSRDSKAYSKAHFGTKKLILWFIEFDWHVLWLFHSGAWAPLASFRTATPSRSVEALHVRHEACVLPGSAHGAQVAPRHVWSLRGFQGTQSLLIEIIHVLWVKIEGPEKKGIYHLPSVSRGKQTSQSSTNGKRTSMEAASRLKRQKEGLNQPKEIYKNQLLETHNS